MTGSTQTGLFTECNVDGGGKSLVSGSAMLRKFEERFTLSNQNASGKRFFL
jgi:hypothetical protein